MKEQENKINIKGKLLSGIIYPEFFPIESNETVLNVGCGNGVQAVIYKDNYKEMVGVDISEERLNKLKKVIELYDIKNLKVIQANVENIPLYKSFDKVIAVDIIEHVVHPDLLVSEIHRLLKNSGKLLITFPAMHDKYENLIRFIGRKILRRKGKTLKKEGWDPDKHQYNYRLKEWINLVEKGNFQLTGSRASTLFPPLHYLGFPKFWFSNKFIHIIDNYLCKLPVLKNYGQTLVCVFQKVNK